jgi:lipoprotein NlpD
MFLVGCHVKGGVIHRVERGESLYQISHSYGVTIEELLEANRLPDPNNLEAGQKLLIPGVRERKDVDKFVWEKLSPASEPPPKVESPPPKAEPTPVRNKAPEKAGPLKMAWPAKGRLLTPFGMRNKKMHNGVDIALKPNEPVRAALEGKVVYVGDRIQGYGNLVIVRHSGNLFSVYAYLGRVAAEKDRDVKKGDVVAYAGPDRSSSFIHFEVRRGKTALDPLKFLGR